MILITGATGFVGQYLVAKLLETKEMLGVFVYKTPPPAGWLKNKNIRIFKVDISKKSSFLNLPKSIKVKALSNQLRLFPALRTAKGTAIR